jgi:hypothetical protein
MNLEDVIAVRALLVQGLQVEQADEKQWFIEKALAQLGKMPTALLYEPGKQPYPMPNVPASFREKP